VLDAEVPDAAAEESLHSRALSAATAEYVASLLAQEQEFIRLRFEEELGQREVAAALGVSRRRVRTLETHVQDGLRRFLEQRGLVEERGRT
jgi:RNA polymerase sigma factor (sigma-70 family)